MIGKLSGGLSPAALATAYLDWSLHLMASPDKQTELFSALFSNPAREDPALDPRFQDPKWQAQPYKTYAQRFLAVEHWWDQATRGLRGVEPKHERIVNFATRQWLDMMSPSNFAATNPQVVARSVAETGENLQRGLRYWVEDFNRLISGRPRRPSTFAVGSDLATTPGDVVLKNELIELIRYHPTTGKLRPEPILIVPAWIMKYYILDLTETRSLVAYLRDQGFEVFIISWKNPDASDADLSMQDYLELGPRAALAHLKRGGAERVHAAGYCLGGTLLSIAAAALARDQDRSLATVSLLASQVDFSDPGELSLFINESQVAFLEDMMATKGYLRADQMAGAFQLLRSNDLIWSRVIRHYLLGERTRDNPLMAWNADATRMPARMHSEYLRQLFLDNALAKGRFKVDGAPVALTDIRCPIYSVATEQDHVSPWASVYKLQMLTDTDVTFVLTNGGHNGGILSEPGHKSRHYRTSDQIEGQPHVSREDWFDHNRPQDGSWWAHWAGWLQAKSGDPIAPRSTPIVTLGAAPGEYVFSSRASS